MRIGSNVPHARAARRVALPVAALYALITYAAMYPTWPSRLRTRIPDVKGDNLLILWTLRWGGRHWTSGWGRLWDAPAFWPSHNALAFTDAMLPIAVLHRGLALVLRSDVLAFNLIYLAAGFASMLGAYLLALRLSGSVGGAIVAGLVYGLATPRLVQYQHYPLLFACLVPFVVLLTIRYFAAPSVRRGVALGVTTGLLCLSTGYYGVMTLVALAIVIPGLLLTWRKLPLRRAATGLVVGAACAVALAAPVALKYTHVERPPGASRYADPYLSARPSDFVRVPPDNRVVRALSLSPKAATVENYLFPGVLASALGAIGICVFLRRARRSEGSPPLETLTLAFCAVAALLLIVFSFGAYMTLGTRAIALPYRVVESLPGFAGLRATSRLIAFPLLVLAIFAAIGFGRITSGWPRRARIMVLIACVAIVFAETSIPIHLQPVPAGAQLTAVNHALARRTPGPVAELPMASNADGGDIWGATEAPRMWLATIDGNPRVSGYSGGQPPGLDALARALNRDFPSTDTLDRLDRIGVRYVILRVAPRSLGASKASRTTLSEAKAHAILSKLPASRARSLGRFGDAYLIELTGTGSRT